MQSNMFPEAYNKEVEERVKKECSEAIRKKNSYEEFLDTTLPPPSDDYLRRGAMIGGFAGFVICVGVCASVHDPGISAGTGFAVMIFSMIFAFLLQKAEEAGYRERLKTVNEKKAEEEMKLKSTTDEIWAKGDREKKNYSEQFEKSVQEISVRFAESQLAREVIEWIENGFYKTINAADRSSFVEIINVPLKFYVYTNKITCSYGEFNFELKRCRNLNGPCEQAALARAIASAIQLDVIMKYPKDKSGTDISINIDYTYGKDNVYTLLTYVAPNGNYQAIRSW